MNNLCYFIIIVFFTSFDFKAQTIKGTVFHENETVPYASVIIRKSENSSSIHQYTKTNKEGFYQIDLKESLDSICVEVNALAFESQIKHLSNIQKNRQIIILNFNLENKPTELEEVVITKEVPIRIKNDTTTYNPESFKDGTERVVEDLLKKLPGIKVEESGEIKFKGKSIKKFLLDGDDLFNSQYTTGSKNLSVDMVEKVQAIENFNENAMLKGLVNAEDVAINILLKKGKTDLSGDAFFSYGIQDRYNVSMTGLFVNKKTKGFLTTAYNNIGNNYSPYDFSSEITSLSQKSEKEEQTKTLIGQGGFYSQLENKYHRINSNFNSELNLLHKFSSKITAKTNLGIYDDRLTRTNKSHTEYSINEEQFVINEIEDIIKKPRLYNANIQLSNKVNDCFIWEYIGKANYQEIDFDSNSLNNEVAQKNEVKTTNFFTKQDFNFTNRINENSAVTGVVLYSNNRAPQDFLLTPGLNIEEGNTNAVISNNQYSRFDKETFKTKGEYYRNFNKAKLKLMAGYLSVNNTLNSSLKANYSDGTVYTDRLYQNRMRYKYQLPNVALSLSYIKKQKYGFAILFNNQYYDIALNDEIRNLNRKEEKFVFSPIMKFQYVLNTKSNLVATYSYNEIVPSEEHLFEGFVLTGFRSFRNNSPNISFLNTHTYNLNYIYNDTFKVTRFSVSGNHNNRSNNYFSRNTINLDNTFTNSFLLEAGNRDYSLNLDFERYMHFMRTTLQINGSYALSFDKNIVNDSNLRDVESRLLFINCVLRASFKSKFYIENNFSYSTIDFLLDNVIQNRFSSFNDTFKMTYKIRPDLKANLATNFVFPDLSKNNNYLFLDSELRYTPLNKRFQYALIMRNLTNNKKFETVSISDYSKTIASHNLLERYILGSASFRF
ncbi:carboxypeptidase-like regulatory domain-containing protein [Flavobacterium lindanitolerans]|uniref:Carboxypeptidase-like protein n=1 Tax=Flavobacterium lindanitolerans TaxID=428988 RepID=A0A497UD17_9FLAO|nr:carboxypeptidase-like regulatory domain-containing protein [Flavobacterium lindanitolerans]PKW30114.1 hypothetical protein B0G92_1763 [Flavobacterium lindanitolerans]RLJ24454.1 hypothetical protein CLV50_2335 [Flavobacterium lindanitolerans]